MQSWPIQAERNRGLEERPLLGLGGTALLLGSSQALSLHNSETLDASAFYQSKRHLYLGRRGCWGRGQGTAGTYCTSLSPLNTVIPLYACDHLRTKFGPAGHMGSWGRRAVRYHPALNHMGFRRLWTELWPPGPVMSLPQEPLESEQKGGSGSHPQTAGCGDSGLWGRAHASYEVTGTGQGKCSLPRAARGRKDHLGILRKPGHRGTRGRGTSTRDTTPQAQRNKKTILTHRGDTFCGDGIQAVARQGGVQTAAIGRRRQRETQGRKEKQNQQHQYAHCTGPLTDLSLRRRSGLTGTRHAPTQSRTPTNLIFGKSTFRTQCQLHPPIRLPRS